MGAGFRQGYIWERAESSESLYGFVVTHDIFETFGISPVRGRVLDADDDKRGSPPVAVLSESFWKNEFGGADGVLGQTITLTGTRFTIVGIIPEMYPFEGVKVWTSMGRIEAANLLQDRHNYFGLNAYARLKPGVSLDQASQEIGEIMTRLAREYPGPLSEEGAVASVLSNSLSRSSKTMLYTLLAASGLLLAVACVNVANMQLVQLHGRRSEFGIKMAIGARGRQIMAQLMTENLLLGGVGGLCGIVLASLSLKGMLGLFGGMNRISTVRIDGDAFVYASIVVVGISVAFGIFGARYILRKFRGESFNVSQRLGDTREGHRWRAGLVVVEVALTCVLLVGAILMAKTTMNLYRSDLGFDTDKSLTFFWRISGDEYRTHEQRIQKVYQAKDRLSELAGVESVGIVHKLPLKERNKGPYLIEESWKSGMKQNGWAERMFISDGFFDAMGISLVAGRRFNDFDTVSAERVVIISEGIAERSFPGENPIGKRIVDRTAPVFGDDVSWKTIVGVVNSISGGGAKGGLSDQIYFPLTQRSSHKLYFIVKSEGSPAQFLEPVRLAMKKIAPYLPIQRLLPYQSLVDEKVARERLLMQLFGAFAVLALLLVAVGLYGLLSYTVRQSTREIGMRIALGAHPKSVFRLTQWRGIKLGGVGLVLGLAFAAGLSRLIEKSLFGVSALNVSTYGVVALSLAMVILFACWRPARRASRMVPMDALRTD